MNAFSSIFNARSIIDGVSLSDKNSIGELISIPALNIYDDGLNDKIYLLHHSMVKGLQQKN